MTRRGAACLADKFWDKTGGGFYWKVGANGLPTSHTKQMYGHAFGIYSLAASYQATKDPATLELAKNAFLWLEEHSHDSVNKGYIENIGADGKPVTRGGGSAVGAAAGQKSMNTSIHILEALTGLYQVWPDPLLKSRVQEMLEICRDKVYSEPGYLIQFFSADWQPTSSPDSFGHDVEAGFLMVEAADALGQDDPRAWTAARHLVDHALQYGWDNSSAASTTRAPSTPRALSPAACAPRRSGGSKPNNSTPCSSNTSAWARKRPSTGMPSSRNGTGSPVPDRPHPRRLVGDRQADGTPASTVKADMWTECYHQGRAMLNVSERLRKLAASN